MIRVATVEPEIRFYARIVLAGSQVEIRLSTPFDHAWTGAELVSHFAVPQ